MTKIALVYGGIAGFIVVATIFAGFLLGVDHGGGGLLVGYSIMIVALTLIFLGIKRHRDHNNGGVIKFGPALIMGLMIAIVAGVVYALGWEGYLAATGNKFMEQSAAGVIEAKKAAGVTGDALAAEIAKMDEMKANYANPLFRLPMTFLEIFPVGAVIALISAAILRNPKAFPARAAA